MVKRQRRNFNWRLTDEGENYKPVCLSKRFHVGQNAAKPASDTQPSLRRENPGIHARLRVFNDAVARIVPNFHETLV